MCISPHTPTATPFVAAIKTIAATLYWSIETKDPARASRRGSGRNSHESGAKHTQYEELTCESFQHDFLLVVSNVIDTILEVESNGGMREMLRSVCVGVNVLRLAWINSLCQTLDSRVGGLMVRLLTVLILIFVSLVCVNSSATQTTAQRQGVIINSVPREIDTNARYLLYISGYIVAAGNTRPTSPQFGVYEYQKILESFKERGFIVISEARQQSRDIVPYAEKVAAQVKQLLKAGVSPKNITVVGASQGSWIAMLVSTYVANRDLNFVFIAACAGDDGFLKLINLHGNVLFISERTDQPGSCQRFRDDAKGINDYNAIEVNTGLKHGFLYRPMKEWVEPSVEWAQRTR